MSLRAVTAVALVLALAGCVSARAVTEAEARAAPARLKADMGPEGDLSAMRITVDMRMTAAQEGGQAMSMRLGMSIDGETYQGGAARITVRYTEFEVVGAGGEAAPDLSGVVLRITCLPERWVVESEGLAPLGKDDVSVQTQNAAGTCTPDRFGTSEDLARALRGLSDSLGAMASSFGSAVPKAEYAFVSLQDGGRQATYVVAGPAQARLDLGGHNVTATFDAQARIGATRMSVDLDLEVLSMAMDVRTEYVYGARPPAPDAQGRTAV